jgi:hypothetical protein
VIQQAIKLKYSDHQFDPKIELCHSICTMVSQYCALCVVHGDLISNSVYKFSKQQRNLQRGFSIYLSNCLADFGPLRISVVASYPSFAGRTVGGKLDQSHALNKKNISLRFRFVVLPSSTYLFTVGVEVVYLHLITLRHTPQSIGLLWTRDRPVAETST